MRNQISNWSHVTLNSRLMSPITYVLLYPGHFTILSLIVIHIAIKYETVIARQVTTIAEQGNSNPT